MHSVERRSYCHSSRPFGGHSDFSDKLSSSCISNSWTTYTNRRSTPQQGIHAELFRDKLTFILGLRPSSLVIQYYFQGLPSSLALLISAAAPASNGHMQTSKWPFEHASYMGEFPQKLWVVTSFAAPTSNRYICGCNHLEQPLAHRR